MIRELGHDRSKNSCRELAKRVDDVARTVGCDLEVLLEFVQADAQKVAKTETKKVLKDIVETASSGLVAYGLGNYSTPKKALQLLNRIEKLASGAIPPV